MFKLVVLTSLIAFAASAPKPGYLGYGAPILAHSAVAIPSAVSHQSRIDVHSSPLIATSYAAAPAYVHALPSALSHTSRVDLHQSAYIAAAPGYAGYGYAAPLAHGYAW